MAEGHELNLEATVVRSVSTLSAYWGLPNPIFLQIWSLILLDSFQWSACVLIACFLCSLISTHREKQTKQNGELCKKSANFKKATAFNNWDNDNATGYLVQAMPGGDIGWSHFWMWQQSYRMICQCQSFNVPWMNFCLSGTMPLFLLVFLLDTKDTLKF